MSDLERAFFGDATSAQIDGWVTARAAELLGEPVAELCLRAGRIDAVYGLRLGADRVVVKVHRPPVDLRALGAAVEVLGHLHATGYPCPRPIAGPVRRDGQVVTVQSFLGGGTPPDAQQPRVRRLFAASLAEHVDLLRGLPPDVVARLGPGPAWTRYHGGPWPVPHDPIFDFSRTPEGWERLDAFAAAATAELAHRDAGAPVVAHGDGYVGNVRVEDDRVVAVFDWDFVVEPVASPSSSSASWWQPWSAATCGSGRCCSPAPGTPPTTPARWPPSPVAAIPEQRGAGAGCGRHAGVQLVRVGHAARLGRGRPVRARRRRGERAADASVAEGHDGQWTVVVPSRCLVVVRLGFTPTREDSRGLSTAVRLLRALP